jgi:outer membrane protein assembly factor BamB
MNTRPTFFAFVLGATVLLSSCERDWPSYRYNQHRSGHQEWAGPLSDPGDVSLLKVEWTWPSTGSEGGFFRSSPIAFEHRVFIGSSSGFFYALDAKTGNKLWQYPDPGPALLGTCNYGNYGIQSSATRARIHDEDAVIFGAPDPSPAVDGGFGSARLWALNAHTGKLIWSSDVVAHVNGTCTGSSTTELHERIAYSSPLVHEDKVYVGVRRGFAERPYRSRLHLCVHEHARRRGLEFSGGRREGHLLHHRQHAQLERRQPARTPYQQRP